MKASYRKREHVKILHETAARDTNLEMGFEGGSNQVYMGAI